MRYKVWRFLVWALRAVLFLLLFGFARKNDQPTVLHYFFDYEWHTSLLVVLLAFFTLGLVFGMVAMLGTLFRQRREIAELKRRLKYDDGRHEADAARAPTDAAL